MKRPGTTTLLTVALLLASGVLLAAQPKAGPPTTAPATAPADQAALAAAQAYLKAKFAPRVPGAVEWAATEAIAAAYPSCRFLRLPGHFGGAAPTPDMVGETVVVRIDARLKVTELWGGSDFDAGLVTPKSRDQARTAAAAVMALLPTIPSPPCVSADDVTAQKDGAGWRCTAIVAPFNFVVRFDAAGRCVESSGDYVGPRPP